MVDQQGDVLLYQSNDNGEINSVAGVIEMSGGLETAAYLSMFGGNEQDDGRQDNPLQWWGNLDETESARQIRSETQYLLRSIPSIPANLRRIEDAAKRDLAWFESAGVASSIDVSASMPGLNKVRLVVTLNGDQELEFVENWKADL